MAGREERDQQMVDNLVLPDDRLAHLAADIVRQTFQFVDGHPINSFFQI